MSHWGLGVLVTTVVLCLGMDDDPIASIQADLVEANRRLRSFAAEYVGKQALPRKGLRLVTDLSGTMEWRRDGGRAMFRIEQQGRSRQELGATSKTEPMETLLVSDGEFVHTLNTVGGRSMAMKVPAGTDLAYDPAGVIRALHEFGVVTVLPEEQHDGVACVVLQSEAKSPRDGMIRQRYWFRKDIGLQVRMSGYDVDGKEVMTTMIREVRINPSLASSRFKFVAPDGVEVMDMSPQPGPEAP